MTIPTHQLTAEVERFFREHAGEFGLRTDGIEVRYVMNSGGFVNYSFRVSDGARALHLKLAVSEDAQAALKRSYGLRRSLERHRAPPVLGYVEVGGTAGLLFPFLPGSSPELSDDVIRSLLGCLAGLWSDESIAAHLPNPPGRTAANCYLDIYHDRFTADLRLIESESLPFLATRDLDLMRSEVEHLRKVVADAPAFNQVLTTPIHGDLWLNNVLWESPESWHILDWDDLQIGDPAMDVAMLTGPTSKDLAPLKRFEELKHRLAPELVSRLELLGRASLLDWVIDPLADWVEARVVGPAQTEEVRKEKEQIHKRALELYRSLYGVE